MKKLKAIYYLIFSKGFCLCTFVNDYNHDMHVNYSVTRKEIDYCIETLAEILNNEENIKDLIK